MIYTNYILYHFSWCDSLDSAKGKTAREEIEYYDNPNIKCKAVGDRKVEYQGKEMSLTAAAKLISGKKYSIAGPRFFKYKGEWLNDIRTRIGL